MRISDPLGLGTGGWFSGEVVGLCLKTSLCLVSLSPCIHWLLKPFFLGDWFFRPPSLPPIPYPTLVQGSRWPDHDRLPLSWCLLP